MVCCIFVTTTYSWYLLRRCISGRSLERWWILWPSAIVHRLGCQWRLHHWGGEADHHFRSDGQGASYEAGGKIQTLELELPAAIQIIQWNTLFFFRTRTHWLHIALLWWQTLCTHLFSQDYVPEYNIGLVWEEQQQNQKPNNNLVPDQLETRITSSSWWTF